MIPKIKVLILERSLQAGFVRISFFLLCPFHWETEKKVVLLKTGKVQNGNDLKKKKKERRKKKKE